MKENPTLQDLAVEAMEIQCGCNLGALALGLHKAVNNLRKLGITNTDELNNHPIVVLWVDKLTSLCGIQDFDKAEPAYKQVHNIINKKL